MNLLFDFIQFVQVRLLNVDYVPIYVKVMCGIVKAYVLSYGSMFLHVVHLYYILRK